MVFLTKITFALNTIKKSRKVLNRTLIDTLRLYVRGGAGGNGLPKYGGIGGKGGDVYLVAKEGITMRNVLRKYPSKRICAGPGGHSENRKLLGDPGIDCTIQVPVGVIIFDEFGRMLGELNEEESKVLVARGGPGGAPVTQFTGLTGENGIVILDLKLIADVGLVGFPNAGKSSLLKAISRAKPKIASYPFTTLEPNVGVLQYDDLRQITMADLPGLIEGAYVNVGLGHKFLKHVERTKLILMVVDVNGFRLSPQHPQRTVFETVALLNKELELYQEDILKKPIILAVNKMDTPKSQKKWEVLEERLKDFENAVADLPEEFRPLVPIKFRDVLNISVLESNKSVQELKDKIRDILDFEAEKKREDEELNLRMQLKLKMMESGPCVV